MGQPINRWLILFAGFIFNFSLSSTSAFSIFVLPVAQETGWAAGSITLAYTFYNVMLCIFGIVIGAIGTKISPRVLMYVGSTFFVAGWIVTGLATSLAMFYLGFGILAGIGGGMLYNFTVTNTMKFFPDRKGFASGLLLGGAAIGPVFTAPLATALLGSMSVFRAYIVLGIIYAALMFAVAWIIRTPAPDYKPAGWTPPATAAATSTGARDVAWREMLKTPTFWLLYVIFVLACTPTMMMLSNVAKIGAEQAALSASQMALAVSLLAICNFLGRLFFGTLSDRIGRYQTLLLALGILTVSVLVISQITSAIPFMLAVCVIGACGGALLVMFPPITSDLFGVKHSGMNYAILFSAYSIASLVGPQLVARFARATSDGTSYTLAFLVAAGLMVVACALLVVITKQARKVATGANAVTPKKSAR